VDLLQGIFANRNAVKYPGLVLAFLVLCLASVTACHNPPASEPHEPSRPSSPVASPRSSPLACVRPVEIPLELTSSGATTVFGEIHGTREAPELFGDVVCNVAAGPQPQRVLVGLELPSSEAAAIASFLAGAGNDALAGRAFWTQPFQSGRTSAAMLALLAELRRIVRSTPRVEVFLFDIPDGTDPKARDAAMASAILEKRATDRAALVLLYSGNVHARKTKGVPWDPTLEPMAYHLVAGGLKITSLNMRNPKGTAWICQTNDASSCGAVKIGGEEPSSGGSPRGIRLSGELSADGYDGVYIVSSATASPPAMSVR